MSNNINQLLSEIYKIIANRHSFDFDKVIELAKQYGYTEPRQFQEFIDKVYKAWKERQYNINL